MHSQTLGQQVQDTSKQVQEQVQTNPKTKIASYLEEDFMRRGRFPEDLNWKRPAIKVNIENCGGNKWMYAYICPIRVVYVCGSSTCHLRNLALYVGHYWLPVRNDTRVRHSHLLT